VTSEADPQGSAPFDTAETSSALASAAPVRVGGTRARAGNAMGRTRVGILEATGRAVEKYGVRRATMGDVASVAGIAKGTLYNHFRTKNDLLTAAIAAGIEALAEDCLALAAGNGEAGLARALRHAAETLSAHPALVRVTAEEPAELIRLLLPGYDGAWPTARSAVARVIAAACPAQAAVDAVETLDDSAEPAASPVDSAATETVLRWLVTFTGSAGVPAETAAGATLLAHAIATLPAS
jgi:AcrR family transcriptional regulator